MVILKVIYNFLTFSYYSSFTSSKTELKSTESQVTHSLALRCVQVRVTLCASSLSTVVLRKLKRINYEKSGFMWTSKFKHFIHYFLKK